MGSTPEAAGPSGHGAEGGADQSNGTFGIRRSGSLVWCERSFGSGSAGLRPPDLRRGFGHDTDRVESLESKGPRSRRGIEGVSAPEKNRRGFGLGEESERSGRRKPSGSRRAGRCPSHANLRVRAVRAGRLIQRSFGSGGSSGRSTRKEPSGFQKRRARLGATVLRHPRVG
jgi:hypothetical protein